MVGHDVLAWVVLSQMVGQGVLVPNHLGCNLRTYSQFTNVCDEAMNDTVQENMALGCVGGDVADGGQNALVTLKPRYCPRGSCSRGDPRC